MSDPVRLILWAVPRTCSSTLLKSFSSIPDSQMIFEMYTTAFFRGPDQPGPAIYPNEPVAMEPELDRAGLLKGQGSGFPNSLCSYKWVKRQLEADYPGKQVIIAKELALYHNSRYDDLPSGYRHLFLMRNPCRMFPSWKKIKRELREHTSGKKVSLEDLVLDQMPPEEVPPGLAYREIFDLLQYVKEKNLDPDSVIIDSDELISHPAKMLSAVCHKVGIPYSDSFLSWEEGTKCVDDWVVSAYLKYYIHNFQYFQKFRMSTGFMKPEAVNKLPDLEAYPPDLQRCIKNSMPFYLSMYEQRLKC